MPGSVRADSIDIVGDVNSLRQDEHRIRLRAAWEFRPEGDDDDPGRRVDLPTTWPADTPRRFRLVRRFGHPRVDPIREQIALELAEVPGVVAAVVDGVRQDAPVDRDADWQIPLEAGKADRHTVILEVDRGNSPQPDSAGPWGVIAVVVAARGS